MFDSRKILQASALATNLALFAGNLEASILPSPPLAANVNPAGTIDHQINDLTRQVNAIAYPLYYQHLLNIGSYLDSSHKFHQAWSCNEEGHSPIVDKIVSVQFEDLVSGTASELKALDLMLRTPEILEAIRYSDVKERFSNLRSSIALLTKAHQALVEDLPSENLDLILRSLVDLANAGNALPSIQARMILNCRLSPRAGVALLKICELENPSLTPFLIQSISAQVKYNQQGNQALLRQYTLQLLTFAKESRSPELQLAALDGLRFSHGKDITSEQAEFIYTLTDEKNQAVVVKALETLEGWVDPFDNESLERFRKSSLDLIQKFIEGKPKLAALRAVLKNLTEYCDQNTAIELARIIDNKKTTSEVRIIALTTLSKITQIPERELKDKAVEAVKNFAAKLNDQDLRLVDWIRANCEDKCSSANQYRSLNRGIELYKQAALTEQFPTFRTTLLNFVHQIGTLDQFGSLANFYSDESIPERTRSELNNFLAKISGRNPAIEGDLSYWLRIYRANLRWQGSANDLLRNRPRGSYGFFGLPIFGDDVLFLIDNSLSMQQEIGGKTKITSAISELVGSINNLPASSKLGVITFGDQVKVVRDLQLFGSAGVRQVAKKVADIRLSKGSGTEISDAIKLGITQIKKSQSSILGDPPTRAVQMVILSDGNPQQKEDLNPRQVYESSIALINSLRYEGIQLEISAVSYGESELLRQLAAYTDGKYFQVQ